MNDTEFQEIGNYISSLWPKFTMGQAQREIWQHKMRLSTCFDVREAIAELYATCKFTPKLPELLACLKRVKQTHACKTAIPHDDISLEHIAQCARDDEEEDWELGKWTPEDRGAAKEDILNREPELAPALGNLKATGKTWRHLIISRCIEKKVTLYPTGVNPIQMHVDEWWAMPHKVGAMAENVVLGK